MARSICNGFRWPCTSLLKRSHPKKCSQFLSLRILWLEYIWHPDSLSIWTIKKISRMLKVYSEEMLCSFRNDTLLHTEGFWVLSRHVWLTCCEMHLLWLNLRICTLWKAHHFRQKSSVQIHLMRSDTLMKLWGGSSLPWHSLLQGVT